MKVDKYLQNYINGKLVAPKSKQYLENPNPATGKIFTFIPDSDRRDVEAAVKAARKAFATWSSCGLETRHDYLMKVAVVIEKYAKVFAKAESMDSGKPIGLATAVDIPRAQSNLRFFATAIKHFHSESHLMEGRAINYTIRQPIGIAGCISPWNLPLYLFTWKIAPALAMGNCVVGKPSEITPVTAYLLSKACIEAGLPKGVLNIVHGLGAKAGSAIVEHPEIKAISFTGGTATGRHIAGVAAPMFKKISLELGGKNPNLIFDDCDFEAMMRTTLNSSFANNGQICLCGSRVYVQRGIYEKFKKEFVKRTKKRVVGDPLAKETKQGAVVSKQHFEKILAYIKLAKEEGGKVLCGGKAVKLSGKVKGGYFIAPTIIEGLNETCRTNQEEIFGPVVTIQPFDTEEEAIRLANSTEFGLASTVWTNDINRANRIAEQIHAGIVWINCWMVRDLRTPFGGVKNSGVGREGGHEALRFFSEAKNVCIKFR